MAASTINSLQRNLLLAGFVLFVTLILVFFSFFPDEVIQVLVPPYNREFGFIENLQLVFIGGVMYLSIVYAKRAQFQFQFWLWLFF
jgi:hypothetical protein